MPYLFTHFTREDDGGEQVFFALSADGLHWQDLSAKPTLTWTQGDGGVRDPFIVRHPVTGMYTVMATDLCIRRREHQWGPAIEHGSRDVVFWQSPDLLHWSEPWSVTLAPEGAGCAWAPEAVWDGEKQAFLLFFAAYTHDDGESRHRIFATHTADFRAFSPVFRYIEWAEHVIDTTIVQDGGMYYRFSASHDIKIDCGPRLLGDFVPHQIPAVASLAGVEGPECYRLPDGRWCLIADRIRENRGYVPVVIDDMAGGKGRVLAESEFDFGSLLKRHGGVTEISEKEYRQLLQLHGL